MKLFATIVVLLSVFSTSHANADVEKFNTVDLSLRSYHFNDRCYDHCTKAFNEDNIGIGATLSVTKNIAVSFGMFKNSFKKWSLYNAVNFTGTAYQNGRVTIRPGFAIGMADGYKDIDGIDVQGATDTGIVPIISPNVSLYVNRFHVNVGMMPSANTIIGILRAGVRF